MERRQHERHARTFSLTGLESNLAEFLMVMFEHEAHHRGQLSAYMKSLEVEQPTTLWT